MRRVTSESLRSIIKTTIYPEVFCLINIPLTAHAGYVCGTSESCITIWSGGSVYRSCTPNTTCIWVPEPLKPPPAPTPPPPPPPIPTPPTPEQCINRARIEYGEYVAVARATILDGSSARCAQKYPAEYALYNLQGNDNSYSQCVRADETVYNDMVAGAKSVLDAKLQGCLK